MFPPEKTNDLQKMLLGMWESMQRAGDDLGMDCATVPRDDEVRVAFKLRALPTDKTRRSMTSYIRAYAAHAGWYVSSVAYKNHRVEFSCVVSERRQVPYKSDRQGR